MNMQKNNLIINFSLGKISEDEFIRQFPVDIDAVENQLHHLLKDGLTNRSSVDIECAMLFGFHFGFSEIHGALLCEVLRGNWHMQHENVVLALQKIKFSPAVNDLYETAMLELPYLQYDESHALGVKCEYALKAIGDENAKIKLEMLAENSNEILAKNATRLLSSWH